MREHKSDIILVGSEHPERESKILLPENMTEIFGGTIEGHLNAILARHVETAKALERTIKAQHALSETMDSIVILLQDPQKSVEEAVKELARLMDLEKKLAVLQNSQI